MHCATQNRWFFGAQCRPWQGRGNAAATPPVSPIPLHPSPNCAAASAISAGTTPRQPLPASSVLASCLWHYRTRHRDRRATRSVAGVASVPEPARDRQASPSLMWRSAMHRGADAMRQPGALQAPPQAMNFIAFPHRPGLGDWPLHPAQTMPYISDVCMIFQ